jgi:PAS domain S-box-containing protein
LLKQIADRSPSVIVVAVAPELRIVFANSAARRAAREPAGDLTGRIACEAFEFIDAALLAEKPPGRTHTRSAADRLGGGTRWWDVSCVPLGADASSQPLVLITAVDVTHHEAARAKDQAAMRDSDVRLRAVLLQIPAAIFIVEAPDGRVAFKSRLVDELLGNPDSDLARAKTKLRGWAVHKDGSPYDLSEYPSRRALFNGETVKAEPMLYHRGDGRQIELEMHAGPVRGETGEVIAAVAVALDVTERHATEARQAFLFQLQDSLRTLTEPREMLTAAAAQLGRHLGAARVGYGEMQPDGETVMVTNGYVDGVPPVNGLFPLMMFGTYHAAQMRECKTVIYEDVQSDERGAREFGVKLGTRAHISVPMARHGSYTGSLYVTHSRPHRWSDDEVALIEEVAGRIWDAAERGRAEARLRESEERLRLVMDSTGLGSWEYDVVTGKTIRSTRHDEIFGYSSPVLEWSYERFIAHIPEPDRAILDAGFRAAIEQGKYWEVECRMIRVDGSRGWLKVSARPHYGRDGQIARLIGTVADITERKEAETAAVETAAKFEMFAQTMPSMVWTSLPDGRIDWFNARVPEYSGIPASELKPDGWTPVHPDDVESSTASWLQAVASGTPYVSEYRIRRHDGVFRWHITRAVPIRGADGEITRWIGTSTDIQDRKSSEQALAELNATLEKQVRERTAELLAAEATLRQSQKMEAVGQLTGGLAHDFNNLLTGITGSLELMATRLSQGRAAEIDRYLHLAKEAAKRAAALTHRLLAFSRRQTLDPKPTDINLLTCGMDELIRRTVGPAVAVRVITAPGLWPVLADPNQLENALLNLCINARDAMPDGGSLTIETCNRFLPSSEAKDLELQGSDYVCLSVSDTGSGMAADVIERAFDPFFTTKPMGEGTGLGLSMVYGFVRQSGGQARIRSQVGLGTTVMLFLPRYVGDARVADSLASTRKMLRGAGETVLVVDDESSVRTLVNEVLEELGYNVLQAEHGAAGLHILQSNQRIDLLVTDVGLPGGMNGRQLADAALVTRPDLKILFITGYAENAVLSAGHLKPGMHIMTKPFSLETLGFKIREIIPVSG